MYVPPAPAARRSLLLAGGVLGAALVVAVVLVVAGGPSPAHPTLSTLDTLRPVRLKIRWWLHIIWPIQLSQSIAQFDHRWVCRY